MAESPPSKSSRSRGDGNTGYPRVPTPPDQRSPKPPRQKKKVIVPESEFVYYYDNNGREVKILPNNKLNDYKWQKEIEIAIEQRKSNQLQSDLIHRKEILLKGYKLKKIIGSGSYAHVFRARDLNNQRDVAIKLIELNKCSKHYKDVCLRNEIYVIRELKHENIVRFYEAFNTSVAYVMVMELVENGTFADFLHKNGALTDENARRLFKGIFYGVDYMHQKLIAHRDLKLENLLLNKNYEPKIVDFSLSVIWDGKKLLTDWCGTPPYFAPEILSRRPYDPLCYDVWSLGVCLYIMMNDTIPFLCINDQEMLKKQLNREWKFRSKYDKNISHELKLIIRAMLEPEPILRLRMSQVLRTRWLQQNIKTPIQTTISLKKE